MRFALVQASRAWVAALFTALAGMGWSARESLDGLDDKALKDMGLHRTCARHRGIDRCLAQF